jgi:hypothetical protein
VLSPSGEATWTRDAVGSGIRVFLERGEAAALLLEDAASTQRLALGGISATRRAMFLRLGRERPRVGPLFLVPPEPGNPFALAATGTVLEAVGFRTGILTDARQLREASCVWVNGETRGVSALELVEFVTRGGGLLVDAVLAGAPDPRSPVGDLLGELGLKVGDEVRPAAAPSLPRSPLLFRGVAPHPATEGIGAFALPYARAIEFPSEGWQVLVYGLSDMVPVGAPVVAELTRGAGRIIVVGGCWWQAPGMLEQADNARFLAACARSLAGRDRPVLADAELADCLFMSASALAQAANEERDRLRTTVAGYPILGVAAPFPEPEPVRGPAWSTFGPSRNSPQTSP